MQNVGGAPFDALLLQSPKKGYISMSRIRLRVKEVAEAQRINMTLLSHKSYVALNTIRAMYRNPYRTVNTDTLQRLADALGVSVFELLEEVPDDNINPHEAP